MPHLGTGHGTTERENYLKAQTCSSFLHVSLKPLHYVTHSPQPLSVFAQTDLNFNFIWQLEFKLHYK